MKSVYVMFDKRGFFLIRNSQQCNILDITLFNTFTVNECISNMVH